MQSRIETVTRPHSCLRGQHTQAHVSLMPHWGTIWWKNAKRLLECDPVLQVPIYFDIFSGLLIVHAEQILIYYLFGSLSGQIWTTGLTSYCAEWLPVHQGKADSHCKHILPPKGLTAALSSLHAVGWQIGTLDLQYTMRWAVWKSLSLSLSLNMHSGVRSNGYFWGIQGYKVWQMQFNMRPGV